MDAVANMYMNHLIWESSRFQGRIEVVLNVKNGFIENPFLTKICELWAKKAK